MSYVLAFIVRLLAFSYKKQGGLHFIKTRWFGVSFYKVKPPVRKARKIKVPACETVSQAEPAIPMSNAARLAFAMSQTGKSAVGYDWRAA